MKGLLSFCEKYVERKKWKRENSTKPRVREKEKGYNIEKRQNEEKRKSERKSILNVGLLSEKQDNKLAKKRSKNAHIFSLTYFLLLFFKESKKRLCYKFLLGNWKKSFYPKFLIFLRLWLKNKTRKHCRGERQEYIFFVFIKNSYFLTRFKLNFLKNKEFTRKV